MRKTKPTIGLLAVLFASLTVCGQKLDSIMNVLATQYPAEKVFIHYDKESYVAGETIWFKAYFLNDGVPSGLSSSFYVQLIDDKGRPVITGKYPVMGATSKGNIRLPDTLQQGNYYLRAATPAMAQYGPDLVSTRNFYVFNPLSTSPSITQPAQAVSIQFFPESGNLVDGLLTVVAFKSTDNYGNPVEVNGVIRTEDGTTICSFKSFHDGIGRMQFKPQAGKKYKAEIEKNGKVTSHALPEVKTAGINLKVQDEEGGKMFLIARKETEPGMFGKLSIMVEMRNRIVYETDIDLEDYPSVQGHLITDSLPSGILHFTVFNEKGLPLAERISFVNNKEYQSKGDLKMDKTDLGRRAENSLELSFPEGIYRSLSVSVTDGSIFSSGNKENIWSALLLSGDLRGAVHNPAYYFENDGDSVKQAIDNLMLTHGWSRFEWKKLLANEFPALKQFARNFLSVSGTVYDDQDKGPVKGGLLNIYSESEDSSSQQYDITLNENGTFALDSIMFYGKTRFFYVYTNNQGKQRSVNIHLDKGSGELVDDRVFGLPARHFVFPVQAVSKQADQRFQWLKDENERVKILERVVVEAKSSRKPIEQINEKYTTGVFRAMGKVNIDNITQPASDKSGNVLDFIKNRIQQVELVGGKFVSRKNFSLNTGQKWAVDVFVDEVPANALQLRTLRVDEVALVKFYEAGFVGVGSSSPGGAIAVYTKREEKPDRPPDKLEYFTVDGYSITKEFYHTDYSKQDASSTVPDHRTTLYWNPDLFMDPETKSVKINFFNNDHSKRLRVVVTGFDAYGKLVHMEKWIE